MLLPCTQKKKRTSLVSTRSPYTTQHKKGWGMDTVEYLPLRCSHSVEGMSKETLRLREVRRGAQEW